MRIIKATGSWCGVVCMFAFFLVCIWGLNTLYHFAGDDCIYGSKVYAISNGEWLSVLKNAWIANANDGYRPVCHLIVRIFTGLGNEGKWFFNLCNTIAMGVFWVLVIRVSIRKWLPSWQEAAVAISLLYIFVTDGDAYLWCAGSVNYLWTSCATLVMLIIHERLEDCHECKQLTLPVVVFLMAFAFVAGWMQEALSLPFLFAIGMYHLTRLKRITKRKVLIWIAYFIGVVVLVSVAGRRAEKVTFEFGRYLIGIVHICVNVIPLWILAGFWLLRVKDKRQFILRNEFSLWVILGSILMALCIGWQGVHSLWACHLFAVIILIREWNASNRAAKIMRFIIFILMVVAMFLQYCITKEFEAFRIRYLNSTERLTYYRNISCGPFARFVCQKAYGWQKCENLKGFARYNGLDCEDAQPITLPEHLYCNLVERDTFCVARNRLSLSFNAYGNEKSNVIVMPLDENIINVPTRCRQVYNLPKGVIAFIRLMIANNLNPRAGNDEQLRLMHVRGKRYVLIPCYPSRLIYLSDIELYCEE